MLSDMDCEDLTACLQSLFTNRSRLEQLWASRKHDGYQHNMQPCQSSHVKMAVGHVNTKGNSSKFNENSYVSVNSECQCCSYLRSEVCYLVDEIKSMTEIINILREEVKYNCTVGHDLRMYSERVKNPRWSTHNVITVQTLKISRN